MFAHTLTTTVSTTAGVNEVVRDKDTVELDITTEAADANGLEPALPGGEHWPKLDWQPAPQ